MTVTPFWIAGQPETGTTPIEVRHPYDGEVVGTYSHATPDQRERAIAAARDAAEHFAAAPAQVRADACRAASDAIAADAERIASVITAESGKPVQWARAEVGRAVATFGFAAEEARRFGGELQRLDTNAAATGMAALVRRFPIGPVLGITPFNFPLNLVAHKVAPALAVGAPIIVKPAPATPLSALLLGEILSDVGLPDGAVSVLPVPNDEMSAVVADERLPIVSFTGSETVGWSIKDSVPRKQVILELGGNAAALIAPDYDDLGHAADRIALFGNYQGGQSCIAVQRVLVPEEVAGEFLPMLAERVAGLVVGDPRDDRCQVGPVINEDAARRIESWLAEATDHGAVIHCGGTRSGTTVAPTVVSGVDPSVKLATEEVFGPVLIVDTYRDLDEGFAAINRSRFGLQAGVFTRRWDVAARAHRTLDVGGVVIGDVPSVRADQMPYGGNKASGVGREGVASAMLDYTAPRVLVLPDTF
ncbi:aldehyde dehydrogenase family protein [Stackebrandtia soli]|uniref:aldehyde dehydrogenase family protein n=1 Tax=Stackebrandtia soli TaxID=1892856 RepID=UPI0039EB0852